MLGILPFMSLSSRAELYVGLHCFLFPRTTQGYYLTREPRLGQHLKTERFSAKDEDSPLSKVQCKNCGENIKYTDLCEAMNGYQNNLNDNEF